MTNITILGVPVSTEMSAPEDRIVMHPLVLQRIENEVWRQNGGRIELVEQTQKE